MRYFLISFMILIMGTSCTEEELQQQRMDRESVMAVRLQKSMFFFQEKESQTNKKSVRPAVVESFEANPTTTQTIPSQPTTNPADPYNPMPLRVGTVEATVYHRLHCPYAKQSLIIHGAANRINYWTREQIANSGRPADSYCMAGVFDCSNVEPAEFVASGNDPWCGANVRSSNYVIDGIDASIAGKTLCSLQGRIGVFVDDPSACINGSIRGSSLSCDRAVCEACTTDCDTACTGCVKVTLAPLNKVTFGMGDANRDGQADVDDYLYYHECYSGPVAATAPCQNVFDFDNDTDVDTTDFDLFVQAYGTGNENWATNNYPNAVINPSKPALPLRVGTDRSVIYHRIDCPAVNKSWQTWGIDRRIDFYSWEQIEASNRTPDTNVCFSGTRDDPSGLLQR